MGFGVKRFSALQLFAVFLFFGIARINE